MQDEQEYEQGQEFSQEELSSEDESSHKRRPHAGKLRKSCITVGSILMVLVVVFSGSLFMFKRTDSCNTICHTPMNSYVVGYHDSERKYLINQHANAGVACDQCHTITLSDQLSMSLAWVTNNYAFNEKTKLLKSYEYDYEEFCLRSGCHTALNVEDYASPYKGMLYMNPHRDLGLTCADCHSIHGQIIMRNNLDCGFCHGSQELLIVTLNSYISQEGLWVNPHTPVYWGTSVPDRIHNSPEAKIMNCTACHGSHVLPYEATTPIRVGNLNYCFRACHHTNDFTACIECHR